ncbi:unnamed protein product [Cylindrotheca closterium]|uniref:3'-5' exonuclease domain-containing protein n=1 Tax=Cylindrotheca closterium TaxID=2856 RepID=A0AAD2FXM1_9STRA|nr:unnamed protein product [Cylindrotheca closterium]
MIVGSAGHPYWQCLVLCDALLSLPNVHVADICGIQQGHDSNEKLIQKEARTAGTPTSLTPNPSEIAKPLLPGFFPGDIPPINIAKLLVKERSLSNPLLPTAVKVTGSLGSLEKKTKKLVTTHLLPLGVDRKAYVDSLPWQSSSDGKRLSVKLIFGRALFQRLGKSQWDAILECLESGQVVEVIAQTRVIDRESLCKWVENRCLELEVREFRILTLDQSSDGNDDVPAQLRTDTAQMPFKHKPKSEWTTPQFAPITMEDIFGASNRIEFVNSTESIQSFVTATAGSISSPAEPSSDDHRSSFPASHLVGIDCEWQPNQLSARGEKQPVLLLQISMHTLQKVYLFDLQTMLRPLLPPDESMNEMESYVSQALLKLFRSKKIIKVGYQASSDLMRVAASYPHLPCFQEVPSVLEVDSFVKRTLQIKKQKKSRAITMSLAKLTAHYLQKSISKECQVSNWSARPLGQNQLEYAAIDAAIGPVLVENAMESINATMVNVTSNEISPKVERWEGDDGMSKVICNWRFTHFQCGGGRSEHEKYKLDKLKAGQVFGGDSSWTVSQNWIVGKPEPPVPSLLSSS